MTKASKIWRTVQETAEGFWVLNLFNPIFWAGILIMIMCALLHVVVDRGYEKIKSWAFMRSKEANTQWTRECYRNLHARMWMNERNSKKRDKFLKKVIRRRAVLIKKANGKRKR